MFEKIDYDMFSLPMHEVEIIKKYEENEKEIIVKIKGKTIKHKCPKCLGHNTKRVGNGYDEHVVNHLFLSNYKTIKLKIYKRRWKCLDCEEGGNTFRERFSFIGDNCSYTETYKDYILTEREYSSLSELARKFHVSETMVYEVINNVDENKLAKQKIEFLSSLDEVYLGVDELSFRGHNYICTITELKTKKVVGVLKTRNKRDLESWLKEVPVETLEKVKGIATDMNATYKATMQKYIAKKTGKKVEEVAAKGVADHYHIKQMFSKLIMEVYRMNKRMIEAGHYEGEIRNICVEETLTENKYRTDQLPGISVYTTDHESYKPITLGFFLSKRYSSLLLHKEENLTEKQYDRLQQIFYEFDPCGYLYQAWQGKELLNKAINSKSIEKVDSVIELFKKSIHYKVKTVGKTLMKRRDEIQNYFTIQITNAFTEGKNTKAKLFKRMAYGYTKKENYMKRLLLCL